MNHLAVDLGSRQSQFCIRTTQGEIAQEGRVLNNQLRGLFGSMETSRVVLETCAEAFAIADMAIEKGHEVSIVPATLAPSLGVGSRGLKTDKRDAQNLSLASCRMGALPSVHLPSHQTRELRAHLTSREVQVKTRTMLINNLRGWMRSQLMTLRSGSSSTFPARLRDAALGRPEGLPVHVDRTLKIIEAINEQIKDADKELETMVAEDVVCKRLMTVPGVGPVTATTFRATVDQIERFKTSHAVESYVGLTPGENSSGETLRRGGITRAGATRARAALIQASWTAWRTRPEDPMVKWAKALSERRPKQVAIVALARKLAGILYALWRDGTNYNPAHRK